MRVQTRLFLLSIIFGTTGAATTLLFDNASGLYALLAGFAGGLLGTGLYIPSLLREWERTGVPGDPRTPEQQKLWEQETSKHQRSKNLAILVGLVVSALLRIYCKEILPLSVPAIAGGLAAHFLRVGWLISRKGGRLGT
jgi:hypothetical protein